MKTDLFPIKKSDLDIRQYLLIKIVMMIRSVRAYKKYVPEFPEEEQLKIKALSDKLANDKVYLIYPSLHRKWMLFPQEIARYPEVIATYKKEINLSLESDKDIYYVLKEYYTLEYVGEGSNRHLELIHHSPEGKDEGLPMFDDNMLGLMNSIDTMLDLMVQSYLEENVWYKRLTYARRMLVEREDGLRTLHNLGFFDWDSLRQLLSTASADKKQAEEAFAEYTDSVKGFAMSVVNGVYRKAEPNEYTSKRIIIKPEQPEADDPTIPDYTLHIAEAERSPQPEPIKPPSMPSATEQKQQRAKKNSAIRKQVFWLLAFIAFLIFVILYARYSLTGSVTMSVGVISAIIIRLVLRLKERYEVDDENHLPSWFVITMTFTALFGTLFGFVACKWLANYVYNISNGAIGPWQLFDIIAALMVGLFFYSWMMRKTRAGKKKLIYRFLMVISVCFTISQCTGSLQTSNNIEHENWLKENPPKPINNDESTPQNTPYEYEQ